MSQPTQKQGAVVRIDPKFRALSRRLNTEARKGPDALNRFTESAEFRRRFNELQPPYWRRIGEAIQAAAQLAQKRDPLPPLGKPLPYRGASKLTGTKSRWKQPEELARLKAAFLKAGPGEGQAERAARILGVTKGTAVLAYQRHILRCTTQGSALAA